MKKITFLILFLITTTCFSQQLVVNVSDNTFLQVSGAFVKQKATLLAFTYPLDAAGNFYIKVGVSYYQNNSGAYGTKITDLINASGTLTANQKVRALSSYGDQVIEYTTTGNCVDALATGNLIPCPASNPISDAQFWNQFFLNQVAGMAATTSTQNALGAVTLIEKAIITQMDVRKTW